jgi:hypothetical protein
VPVGDAPAPDVTFRLCAESLADATLSVELSRRRSGAPFAAIRADLVSLAIEQRVATLSQVARYLNRDSSALGRLLARQTTKPKS